MQGGEFDGKHNYTRHDRGRFQWMSVDLRGDALDVSHYCLRHGRSLGDGRLRSWELQGREGGDAPLFMLTKQASDRVALEALFKSCGGVDWASKEGWMTDAPLGEWYGVTVDAEGRVIKLDLHYNNLAGPLPRELQQLSALRALYLHGNKLTGPIPAVMGQLRALIDLYLASTGWVTLSKHTDDRALADEAFATAGWAVEGGKGFFSQFRVLMTGPNSAGWDYHNQLWCAGLELYGTLLPEGGACQ